VITPTSPEWVLLGEIYHHVLKRSPSPERAKIDISSRKLPLRAEMREHRARPTLRLKPGEQPPAETPTITLDQPVPDGSHCLTWNWERSCATRRDAITKSLFEYVDIVGRRDDVLDTWPAQALGGRPSSNGLVQGEAMRRFADPDGQIPKTQKAFGNQLSDWLRDTHPDAAPMVARTAERQIRSLWQQYKKSTKP
jgi:hypothetical protein